MTIEPRDCWFLTGPTASGKSQVGLALAERLGAEIVSLDSMAIYRGMEIGTAKPTADDMRRVPQEYIEIAYTVGAKPRQVMRDVAFRAMLPSLVDNLRITLGWCWTYLIIAEIVAADSGLGFVIWTARRYMKTPEVMAGVVAIGIIGLLTDQLLRYLHRRAFRYL